MKNRPAFTHVPYLNGDKIHDSFIEQEYGERGEREFRVTNDRKVPDPVSLIIRFRFVTFTILPRNGRTTFREDSNFRIDV